MAFCSSSLVVNAASVRVSLRKEGRGALLKSRVTDFAREQHLRRSVAEGFLIPLEEAHEIITRSGSILLMQSDPCLDRLSRANIKCERSV